MCTGEIEENEHYPDNCCSNCIHGNIHCQGLDFAPITEKCDQCHGIKSDCKYHTGERKD